MRNGLEIAPHSVDLPCSRKDHRSFCHGMCQTVVEPAYDQNVMVNCSPII